MIDEPGGETVAGRAGSLDGAMAEKMAEKSVVQNFPRRDGDGRVISVSEFLVAALLGTVVAAVGLTIIDGLMALVGLGTFGRASGWLALILPGLLFFDEVRGWRGYRVRFLVALVSAGAAVALGLIVANLFGSLPPLVSGGLGAAVAAVIYAFVWFVGIRWLTGQQR